MDINTEKHDIFPVCASSCLVCLHSHQREATSKNIHGTVFYSFKKNNIYYHQRCQSTCHWGIDVWPAVTHGSSCFGLWDARHAGPQLNAQNGGTIEKFCSSHPSLSRLLIISLVRYWDIEARRTQIVETSVFDLRLTGQRERTGWRSDCLLSLPTINLSYRC